MYIFQLPAITIFRTGNLVKILTLLDAFFTLLLFRTLLAAQGLKLALYIGSSNSPITTINLKSSPRVAQIGKLVLPNLQGKQMGQVIVTLTGTNRIDQVLAQRGFISLEEVRSCTLDDVLLDTGVTLLYLPASVITQLCLVQGGEVQVNTAARV
ncbi:MAG: hypothetical protein RMZ69_04785 [Nostoc sp. ChiQUE01a]|nr:hypothetical protein [Nostoc sp. ChiQUE01a]